jgi:hypothetical protein
MDSKLLIINAGVNAVVVITGWWLVHHMTAWRDRKNKQREIKTQYLIDAYRRLSHALAGAFAGQPLHEVGPNIARAITDIQLFGSILQVDAAVDLQRQLMKLRESHTTTLNAEPLLKSLRDDLRTELHLDHIPHTLVWLTFAAPQGPDLVYPPSSDA